jgi:peroxiredoxin
MMNIKIIKNIALFIFALSLNVSVAQTMYSVSTARDKSLMKLDFPYDITFKTMDKTTTTSDKAFRTNGKPLIVMFWLTTCFPCRMELQAIKEKYPTWKKETDFELLAVSYDFPRNEENIYQFVKEQQWPFTTLWDINKEFGTVLPGGLNGLPQVFLFDKDGKLVYQKRKYMPGDEDILYAKVKELNHP